MKEIRTKIVETGIRLDSFLIKNFPNINKKRAKEICLEKKATVNGRFSKPGYFLSVGDEVSLLEEIPELSAGEVSTENKKLKVVYEDEYFLCVDKERDLHSVRLRSEDPLTLADQIAKYCPETLLASEDKRESGLVQRLDYHTTGLAIAAKTKASHAALKKLLFEGKIKKEYLAIVEGRLSEASCKLDLSLVQDKKGKKMLAFDLLRHEHIEPSKIFSAKSEIERIEEFRGFSLVKVTGTRMRRHQVRAHLASMNHPLVGDRLYGSTRSLFEAKDLVEKILKEEISKDSEGFILIANSIELVHPFSGERLEIKR